MIVNIFNYAYPDGPGTIHLEAKMLDDGQGLCLRLEDRGKAFNPLAHPEPDISIPVIDRPIGRLGIFITRRKTDRLSYERKGRANILTIEKHLPREGRNGSENEENTP